MTQTGGYKPTFLELTDSEWVLIEQVITSGNHIGRPRADDRRVLNAIFFVLTTGSRWDAIPMEQYGSGKTAWRRYHTWKQDGTWAKIIEALPERAQQFRPRMEEKKKAAGAPTGILAQMPDPLVHKADREERQTSAVSTKRVDVRRTQRRLAGALAVLALIFALASATGLYDLEDMSSSGRWNRFLDSRPILQELATAMYDRLYNVAHPGESRVASTLGRAGTKPTTPPPKPPPPLRPLAVAPKNKGDVQVFTNAVSRAQVESIVKKMLTDLEKGKRPEIPPEFITPPSGPIPSEPLTADDILKVIAEQRELVIAKLRVTELIDVMGSRTRGFAGAPVTVINNVVNAPPAQISGVFSNLEIVGSGNIAGNATIGGTSRLNQVSVTKFITALLPSNNNTLDLGAYGTAWRDIYTSGTVYTDTISSAGSGGSTTIAGNFAVQGNTQLGDSASDRLTILALIDSAVRVSSTLAVSGAVTSSNLYPWENNAYDIGAYGSAWRDIYASGTVSAGTLSLTGTGTTTLAGNLAVQGNTRLGDSTSDLIQFSGRLSSDLVPAISNSLDLGTAGLAFRDLWASGAIRVGVGGTSTTIGANGNLTLSGSVLPASNNSGSLGTSGQAFANLYVSSTAYLGTVSSSEITPFANNTSELGSFGSAWSNIFSSSTIFANNIAYTGTLSASGTGTSTISGNLEVLGNTRLGDSTADLIDLTGRISTSIVPNIGNTLDFGSTHAWRRIYASTSIQVTADAAGTTPLVVAMAGSPTANPLAINNSSGASLFYVSPTGGWGASGTALLSGDLLPGANNTYDLGSFALGWNELFVSGAVRVGAGAASSTLGANGNLSLTGSVLPASNNSGSLGASGQSFANLYVSSTAFLGPVSSTLITGWAHNTNDLGSFNLAWNDFIASGTSYLGSVSTTQLTPWANNTYDLGSYGRAWANGYVSGTMIVGNLNPTATNSNDLGTMSTAAWRNIYVSSTAYLNNVSTTLLTPWSSNLSDIGVVGNAFRDVYVSSALRIGIAAASTTIGANGNFSISGFASLNSVTSTQITPRNHNTSDLGSFGSAWKDFFSSGTSYLGSATTTQLTPWANNTYDLGSFGRAWKDVYSSGTFYVGSVSLTDLASSTISGNLTVLGNTQLGDTSGDLISLLGSVNSHIIPNTNVYNLGSAANRWDTVYADEMIVNLVTSVSSSIGGTISSDWTINSDNATDDAENATLTFERGTPSTNAVITWSSANDYFDFNFGLNVTGPSFFQSVSTTQITPITHNLSDLGSFGRAWRDLYVSGTFYSSGVVDGAATTTFNNNLAVLGNTRLGDATSDQIQISGRFSSDLNPNISNALDLGATGLAWRDLWASGSLRLGVGSASTTIASNGNITLTGTITPATNNAAAQDLGASGLAWNELFVSGTAYVGTVSSSQITAFANNLSDLGSFGRAWKDLYVSGSFYAGAIRASSTATSTFANGIQLSGGCFLDKDGTCVTAGGGGANTALSNLAAVAINLDLDPDANNALDLGSFGTAWKDLYVSNSIRLGSGTASTTISANGNATFGGNLFTQTSNSFDLGATGLAFRNLWASGSLRLGVGAASTTIASNGNITLTGAITPATNNAAAQDLGATGLAWNELFVSGTSYLGTVSSSQITPWANNLNDLGSFGRAWADVMSSGTVYANGLNISGTCTGCGGGWVDDGTVVRLDGSTDNVGIGSSTPYAKLAVDGDADEIQLVVRAHSTQNRHLIQFEDDTSVTGWIDSIGKIAASTSLMIGRSDATNGGVNFIGYKRGADTSNFLEFLSGANASVFFHVNNFGGVFASDTSYMRDLLPSDSDTYDLGSVGFGWGVVYVSDSVRLATGSTSSTLGANGNLTLTGSILPAINDSTSVGAFGLALANLYVSSTAYLGSATTTQLTPWANNAFDLGSFGRAWKDLFVSGVARFGSASSSQITPYLNNTSDLGSYGAGWKNMFSSGTIYGAAQQLTGILTIYDASINMRDSVGSGSSTISSNGNFNLSGSLLPGANNATDIGGPGIAINDLFSSGTVYIGGNSNAITLSGIDGAVTSTFGGAVSSTNLMVSGRFQGAGLNDTDCDSTSSMVQWDVTSGRFACGKTLRTETLSDATPNTLFSSSLEDITDGTEPSMTPTSANHRMWITGQVSVSSTDQNDEGTSIQLKRGGATDCTATQVNSIRTQFATNIVQVDMAINAIDAHASTTALTYRICGQSTTNAGTTFGHLTITITEIPASGADLAEVYGTLDETLEAGDVVAIDSMIKDGVKKTTRPYQSDAIGVYSTNPGLFLDDLGPQGVKLIPVGLAGRVPVKVSLENGPIKPGDLLTPSSKPGVAMRATKAGAIIGQAMTGYDGKVGTGFVGKEYGLVLAFIKNAYWNGAKIIDALPGLQIESVAIEGSDAAMERLDFSRSVLKEFVVQKSAATASSTLDASEIFTDRLAAGLEIISPQVTTDLLITSKIEPAGKDISISLQDGGVFAITRGATSSTPGVSVLALDSLGSLNLSGSSTILGSLGVGGSLSVGADLAVSGTVRATKLVADEVEGAWYTRIGERLDQLFVSVSGLSSSTPVAETTLDLAALSNLPGLTVSGMTILSGGLRVDSIGSIGSEILLANDVLFVGRPYLTTDTAGFAVVRQGERSVEVAFDRAYLEQPIVNASITMNTDPRLAQATTEEERAAIASEADAAIESLFAAGVQYVVKDKNEQGFTIVLNKPAPQDIALSWTAFAVRSAKTFSSKIVEPEPVVTAPQPPPVLEETASSTPETTTEVTATTSTPSEPVAPVVIEEPIAPPPTATVEPAPEPTPTADTSEPAPTAEAPPPPTAIEEPDLTAAITQ